AVFFAVFFAGAFFTAFLVALRAMCFPLFKGCRALKLNETGGKPRLFRRVPPSAHEICQPNLERALIEPGENPPKPAFFAGFLCL
ncbi:MAG: hypothetical protein AB7O98_08805, partial [Hyphomonadaceae bacterium]